MGENNVIKRLIKAGADVHVTLRNRNGNGSLIGELYYSLFQDYKFDRSWFDCMVYLLSAGRNYYIINLYIISLLFIRSIFSHWSHHSIYL